MAIGTAQPTAQEMGGIPHHMLAVADPGEPYSVGRYVAEAGRCLEDILRRGKQPILVGGTGLYIDSLLSGRDFSPKPAGNSRARLQGSGGPGGPASPLAGAPGHRPSGGGTHPPQRRKTHPPGPGGVVRHRGDHLPARPTHQGGAPPLPGNHPHSQLSGASRPLRSNRPAGGRNDGPRAAGRGWRRRSGGCWPPGFPGNAPPCRPSATKSSSPP